MRCCLKPFLIHSFFPQPARVFNRSLTNAVTSAIPSSSSVVISKEGMGGRSSISGRTVTVFGCSGLMGKILVNRLAKQGTQVIVPYRSEEYAVRALKPAGDLGQIVPMVCKDYETKSFTLEQSLVHSAHNIAYACRTMNVPMLVHMSHISADPHSASVYMRMKAKSEEVVKQTFPNATVVRSASIYGYQDRFIHLLGWLSELPYLFPIYNGGKTQYLPVNSTDVASALTYLAFHPHTIGKNYEFYGPKAYTFEELVDLFLEITYKFKTKVNLTKNLAMLHAYLTDKSDLDPFLCTDTIERFYIDEQPRLPCALTLRDCGVAEPKIFEYTALEYARVFRNAATYPLAGPSPSEGHW